MEILTFNNEDEWLKHCVHFIEKIYNSSNRNPHFALSGGNTPLPLFKELAKRNHRFDQAHFWQVDERYVPKTHPSSNFHSINEALLKNISTKKIHRFQTELPIKECLNQYEKDLRENLPYLTFDLAIMGIGPDGHTASIFPSDKSIDEETELVLHTIAPPEFEIADRLTITFPLILKSKKILILLKNRPKIFNAITKNNSKDSPLPFQKLLTDKTTIINLAS